MSLIIMHIFFKIDTLHLQKTIHKIKYLIGINFAKYVNFN